MGWVVCGIVTQFMGGKPRLEQITDLWCAFRILPVIRIPNAFHLWNDAMLQTWPCWENLRHALSEGPCSCLVKRADFGGILVADDPSPLASRLPETGNQAEMHQDVLINTGQGFTNMLMPFLVHQQIQDRESRYGVTESDFQLHEKLQLWEGFLTSHKWPFFFFNIQV